MKLDYKHIFEWLIKNGEIKGFHYDWLGELERQGKYVSRILKTTTEGFYKANVYINGIKEFKSFFPRNMTREEVCKLIMDTIILAKKTATYDAVRGVWKIEHKICPNVKLRIIIKKSGHIKSAFPIIE